MTSAPRVPSPRAIGVALLWMAVAGAGLVAQAPDLSGTWTLDASRSRVADHAGLAGLIGAGVPDTLYITQAANGTVIVESRINESHARVYMAGGTSSTPVFVGPAGSISMTSRWDGRALIAEGIQRSVSGPTTLERATRERLALGQDGRTLTVSVATTTSGDTRESTLVYTRTSSVEPCQRWPTPCKTPAR